MKQYSIFEYGTHSILLGEADTLHAAKLMASRMKAYHTRVGWVKPEIFRSDDCIEDSYGRYPNPYATAVTVWHPSKEKWV